MKKNINWEVIKVAYETENISNVALATAHNISEAGIRRRAKAEGWKKFENKKPHPYHDIKKENITDENGNFFIDIEAKKQFDNLKEKLGDQVTAIDEPLLVALCNQSSRYKSLEKRVLEEGEVAISSKGIPYLNPTYNALQSTLKTISTISKEFGLTIASRKRAGVVASTSRKGGLFDFTLTTFPSSSPNKKTGIANLAYKSFS